MSRRLMSDRSELGSLKSVERLCRNFIAHALPLWAGTGYDASSEHFVEALTLDARAETTGRLRTRTAARVIYVYAHADVVGAAPAGARGQAVRAMRALKETAWIAGSNPGFASTFDRHTGHILDDARDLYDHACVLLALAWLYRATGNASYLTEFDAVLAAIETTLAADHGGFAEDQTGRLPRRQNPHMHLFEACLAMMAIAGRPQDHARTAQLHALFRDRFMDNGILREFFGPAWEITDEHGSDRLEPGHMAEWVWLLRRYQDLGGPNEHEICHDLLACVRRVASVSAPGFLPLEVRTDLSILNGDCRLWAQVEWMKALLAQYRATGDETYAQELEALAARINATFLSGAPPGAWRDSFDQSAMPTATTVPASSLYHLWTFVADVEFGPPPVEQSR